MPKIRAFITFLLAIVITISFECHLAAQAPKATYLSLNQKIDRYLAQVMEDWQVPGLAVGIVEDHKIIYLHGLSTDSQNITPDSPFVIGSVSKSFTSLAIMQLVDAGKISLDAPVTKYLPYFKLAEPIDHLTLAHLLHHTSGLSMETDIKYLNLEDSDRDPQALRTYIQTLSTARLISPIGTKFNYANTNYVILGMVIEEVSGMPYSDYIQQYILNPLNMNHSYTSQITAKLANPPLVKGYRFWLNKPIETTAPYSRQNIPAGYLISSARDMCHYLMVHLNGGKFGDNQLVSSARMAELHEPKILAWGPGIYSMGWVRDKVDGLDIDYHGGELVNFSSNVTLVPHKKWGIVILTNISPGIIGDPIRRIYVGLVHILQADSPPKLEIELGSQLLVFGLPVLLILQIIGFKLAVIRLQRWQSYRIKSCKLFLLYGIIYPLVIDGIISIAFLIYLPFFAKISLSLMIFAQPDLAYIALVSGAIAGCSLIRTCVTIYLYQTSKLLSKIGY